MELKNKIDRSFGGFPFRTTSTWIVFLQLIQRVIRLFEIIGFLSWKLNRRKMSEVIKVYYDSYDSELFTLQVVSIVDEQIWRDDSQCRDDSYLIFKIRKVFWKEQIL